MKTKAEQEEKEISWTVFTTEIVDHDVLRGEMYARVYISDIPTQVCSCILKSDFSSTTVKVLRYIWRNIAWMYPTDSPNTAITQLTGGAVELGAVNILHLR